jgi:hypothetical protein
MRYQIHATLGTDGYHAPGKTDVLAVTGRPAEDFETMPPASQKLA